MGEQSKEVLARIVSAPVHLVGNVLVAAGGRLRVATECGELDTRRAASCLLAPEEGDQVLVSGASVEDAWIIAVLERRAATAARISLDGDLHVHVAGELSLQADTRLTLRGEEMDLRGARARVVVDSVEAVGNELTASVGKLRLVGNVFETMAERFIGFFKNSVRSVEGTDQVRSGSVDYQAANALSLHGRDVLATAENLVRVDAAQINIG